MFDGNLTGRLSRWVINQLIQDVPEGSELCEFDCRRLQCTEREWMMCNRRLSKAAGELMPDERNDRILSSKRKAVGL